MIGIFDSGSGGLTVAKAIRQLAPKTDLLYFGDVARVPYGNRSEKEIERLTLDMMSFLRRHGATTIVSACNSISASVIRPLFELFGVETSGVIEMVGPAIDELSRRHITRFTLFATEATCHSDMYARVAAQKGITCTSVPCPTLATAVEHDDINAINVGIADALRRAQEGTAAVLLGCTHYPLVADRFAAEAERQGKQLTFIDPAESVALAALRHHGASGEGTTRVVCSARTPAFAHRVESLFGLPADHIEILELPPSRFSLPNL